MNHDWAFDFNLTRGPDGTYRYDGPDLSFTPPSPWMLPAVMTATVLATAGFFTGLAVGYALASRLGLPGQER